MNKLFPREEYLEKIERCLGKEIIVVLTGQRRVGKSCTLRMLRDRKSADPNNNIIFIDKEKREFDMLKTYAELNDHIEQHLQSDKNNYVLIDEIQDIAEFERTLRHYRTEPGVELIVTGSNAKMLSGELTTIIGGRYKEIHIQPLCYEEFLQFHNLADSDEALTLFIQYGGLPGLRKIGLDESEVRAYQSDILNTVLLKDVIMRNNIRNAVFMENLVRFLGDNIGKIISAGSIAKYMKSQGMSVTATTVLEYTKYLCEAFIINRVSRYDIHGKHLFESLDKFYFEDHGLRNAIVGGSREGDIEKIIENIVYQHLVRKGYNVNVGMLQAGEIDFVCNAPGGGRCYIQVAFIVADEKTREREFGNLHAIPDNYPKYVVSLTPMLLHSDDNGITHLHLREFLKRDKF